MRKLSTPMIKALEWLLKAQRLDFSEPVTFRPALNTVVALVDRGLVQAGENNPLTYAGLDWVRVNGSTYEIRESAWEQRCIDRAQEKALFECDHEDALVMNAQIDEYLSSSNDLQPHQVRTLIFALRRQTGYSSGPLRMIWAGSIPSKRVVVSLMDMGMLINGAKLTREGMLWLAFYARQSLVQVVANRELAKLEEVDALVSA